MLEGKVTSIKLEDVFWDYLDQAALEASVSWAEYARGLLDEIGPTDNRASSIKQALFRLAATGGECRGRADEDLVGRRQWVLARGDSMETLTLPCALLRVGRSPMCDLRVDDPECSKLHAALFPVRNFWWVCDLASKNGVWRNGKRIWSARVDPDTPFTVGETEVRLLI